MKNIKLFFNYIITLSIRNCSFSLLVEASFCALWALGSRAISSYLIRVTLLKELFCLPWAKASSRIGCQTWWNLHHGASWELENLASTHRCRQRPTPRPLGSLGPDRWPWPRSCDCLWLSSLSSNLSYKVRSLTAYCFFCYSPHIRSQPIQPSGTSASGHLCLLLRRFRWSIYAGPTSCSWYTNSSWDSAKYHPKSTIFYCCSPLTYSQSNSTSSQVSYSSIS